MTMDAVIAARGSPGASFISILFAGGGGLLLIATWCNISWRRLQRKFPTTEQRERSRLYGSGINSRSGFIQHDSGNITWRFNPMCFPRKGDVLVYDPDDQEVLRIHRPNRFHARFQMMEAGQITGVIRMRSLLRNKYTLELKDGTTWTFWMPLFTIFFYGESTAGGRIWIQMGPGTKRHGIFLFHRSISAPGIGNHRLYPLAVVSMS